MRIIILPIIVVLILLVSLVSAQEKVFEASFVVEGLDEVNITDGNVTIPDYKRFVVNLEDLRLTKTTFITNNTEEFSRYTFRADVTSSQGVLYSTLVPVSFYIPHATKFSKVTDVVLFLPYSDQAEFLKIYYNNTELISVPLGQVCNNNNQCGQYENYLSCPSDCSSGGKDNYCSKVEDNVCDSDCLFGDPDCYTYPKYSTFTPSLTTEFSKVNKEYLDYLRNVKLGKDGLGQIDFDSSRIDVSGANLDSNVVVERGRIGVQNLPGLNKSATLTFFGITGNVLKDGKPCLDCNSTQDGNNLVVKVGNFDGVYSVSGAVVGIQPSGEPGVGGFPIWIVGVVVLLVIIGIVVWRIRK